MNWFGFIKLMRDIYGPGLPDLEKIQKKGLLAVKIGQTFALRIDFLDEAKCRHLAALYRQNIRIPAEDFHRLLLNHTDIKWRGSFRLIDEHPIASASVGQVHRAELRDGRVVAVKLIKGDFKQSFVRDVESVRSLMRAAVFFYPKLARVADPVGILSHIEEYTLSELNLENEVRHGQVLRDIYKANRERFDLSRLAFPEIMHELSSTNVLVSEYIEGKTFDELLDEGKLEYSQLLNLFHIHGFYMFGVGTFHGDIHPGNIILKDGKLYFIDTGAISRAGEKIRRGLFGFFEALSYYDYGRCAEWLNKMADREITGKPYHAYRERFLTLYSDFTDSTVGQVSLTRKMMETIKLGVNSGMVFEPGMYPIIKSLMYLDGMVLKCKPDAILMRDMREFIEEFRKMV
ncbi:MAG: AarF/ABC1/UbiB kinase family protein [Candidatus Edwardsbacteria bacterium]|nr:AarF/ABC1/UbiB kinase family protein [Candidatus Edwardsbacteria bacterium]